MRRYIIGLGSGRCGTKSLAKLLNECKYCNVSHEFRRKRKEILNYRLRWYFTEKEIKDRVRYLKRIKGKLVGDVASYYANYVEYLIQNLENVKFIYLYRDVDEVIKSFLKITKKKGKPDTNHWISYKHPDIISGKYSKVKWDRCFPKYYKVNDKKSAIRKYCEQYTEKMKKLRDKYSNLIFPVNVKMLNDQPIQKAIFDFLEIPEKDRKYQQVKENQSNVKK